MALKVEFVVQAFSNIKRGVLRPNQPEIFHDQHRAVRLAERLAQSFAGVIVLEQHVDRDSDVFNEPTIVWRAGQVPPALIEELGETARSHAA